MSKGLAALSERRLLIVTGKGGTGKTTVAAALGLLTAQQGIDTVVIEMGDTAVLPRLLSDDPAALEADGGRNPVRVAPHLFTLRIVRTSSRAGSPPRRSVGMCAPARRGIVQR